MEELRDVMRVFRFLTRLKDFKNFTRGQKVKTSAVGAGLFASVFGFFSGGGLIPLEDFQLTAEHQQVNSACMAIMERRDAEFSTVYDSENCACTARQWAALSYSDSHDAFEAPYDYIIDFYVNYTASDDAEEQADFGKISKELIHSYMAEEQGAQTGIPALRKKQMQQVVDVVNICTDYDSFQGEAFQRMVSLPAKGENPHTDPETLDDGRVEIALRGDISTVALAALQ